MTKWLYICNYTNLENFLNIHHYNIGRIYNERAKSRIGLLSFLLDVSSKFVWHASEHKWIMNYVVEENSILRTRQICWHIPKPQALQKIETASRRCREIGANCTVLERVYKVQNQTQKGKGKFLKLIQLNV